jgi:GR25 family glycosyltransferase involved in LPS biosynthesis
MKLIDYFDRACVIHLPDRTDRYRALESELKLIGVDIGGPKVQIPFAPMPSDANGFYSKGVYGSFLSHLGILKQALEDKLQTIWVLEDDAIFSHRLAREQEQLADFLQKTTWDLCFFGHSLRHELKGKKKGLVHSSAEFRWCHCYAVHARTLPRLVTYLEETMSTPEGDPKGGKMFIDGAYNLFRRFNPDIVSLVANPVLSLQRGCTSSLNESPWYDRQRFMMPVASFVRSARDEIWRSTGVYLRRYVRAGPRKPILAPASVQEPIGSRPEALSSLDRTGP